MSERASLSVQRSCLAAQPSDEPVTDEPPHLADRRLVEVGEYIEALMISEEQKSEEAKHACVYRESLGATKALKNVLTVYESYFSEAAEAREERPSGRPNDNSPETNQDNCSEE